MILTGLLICYKNSPLLLFLADMQLEHSGEFSNFHLLVCLAQRIDLLGFFHGLRVDFQAGLLGSLQFLRIQGATLQTLLVPRFHVTILNLNMIRQLLISFNAELFQFYILVLLPDHYLG